MKIIKRPLQAKMFFSPSQTKNFADGESNSFSRHSNTPFDKDQSIEDSFIKYEEQAMREDAETESENQTMHDSNEIQELKYQINQLRQEKEENKKKYSQETENLKETIQSLRTQLQFASNQKDVIDRHLSEQQELNSDLSSRLLQLEPLSNSSMEPKSSDEVEIKPDALISRIRALEIKLATETQHNQELEKEIETRKNHFLEEISRLSLEISNSNAEDLPVQNSNQSKSELILEGEISTLKSQISLLSNIQKSLTDNLQHELENSSNINSQLLETQRKFEESLSKNANNESIMNTLMTMLNVDDPFNLIFKIRRLIADKNHAHQQRSELVSLQMEYQKEVLINKKYQEELRELKDQLINTTRNQIIPTSDPNEVEKQILEIKTEYETQIEQEKEINKEISNKLESIRRRDNLIREQFLNLPPDERTDMNQAFAVIFDCLSNNSNSDSYEADIDAQLEETIKNVQELALNLVPQEALAHSMKLLKRFSDIVSELDSRCMFLQSNYDALHEKVEKYIKGTQFLSRYKTNTNMPQRLAKPPTSSRHNKSNNSFLGSFIENNNSDLSRVMDFSNMSFSRSPIVAGGTPKLDVKPYPMKERGNGVSPNWKPRASPSYPIRYPENE